MIEELKADYSPDTMRAVFDDAWKRASEARAQGLGGRLEWKPLKITRSLQANALMWVRLGELSKQTDWHGIKLSPEEFKDLLSAGIAGAKVVPNIQGSGFVVLGKRTSKMSIQEMNDMILMIESFGSDRGVKFSADPRIT